MPRERNFCGPQSPHLSLSCLQPRGSPLWWSWRTPLSGTAPTLPSLVAGGVPGSVCSGPTELQLHPAAFTGCWRVSAGDSWDSRSGCDRGQGGRLPGTEMSLQPPLLPGSVALGQGPALSELLVTNRGAVSGLQAPAGSCGSLDQRRWQGRELQASCWLAHHSRTSTGEAGGPRNGGLGCWSGQ